MTATAGKEREPPFRAPWPAVAIAASILGAYLAQSASGRSDRLIDRFGFSPATLSTQHWAGLTTALFVHVGWAHAGMNALGALAFGAPVARWFGLTLRGVLAFFAFYLVCGAIASLGFAGVHPGSMGVLVGASGAVSGLMGAASRLLTPQASSRQRGLAPFLSGPVVGMAVGWIVVNLLLGVFGFTAASGGAPIAWEAHLFGYAAGLLAVGPTSWVLHGGRRSPRG